MDSKETGNASKCYNKPVVKTIQHTAFYSGICLVSEERVSEKQAIAKSWTNFSSGCVSKTLHERFQKILIKQEIKNAFKISTRRLKNLKSISLIVLPMTSAEMFQNVGQVCCSTHRALLGASGGESSGFLQSSQVSQAPRDSGDITIHKQPQRTLS